MSSTEVPRVSLYRFCPRCGAEAVIVQPPHLTECRACGLRLYHNACAATAAILLDPEQNVLLIRRANEPAKGRLAFPGGFVDNGESAEAGLRRELREEVGLEATSLEFLLSHPNSYAYGGVIYATLDLFFIGRVPGFAAARPLDAVTELVVTRPEELNEAELAFESMRAAWRGFRQRMDRTA